MPGGDRTGPLGMGPMTGRAAGYCAGYPVPGYMNPYGGRGLGMAGGRGYGRGAGRGFRRGYGAVGWDYPAYPVGASYPPPFPSSPVYGSPEAQGIDPEQEVEALKQQAGYLEKTIADIKSRITEIESASAEKKEQ